MWDGQVVANKDYLKLKAQAFSAIETFINGQREEHGRSSIAAPQPGIAFGRESRGIR